MSREITNSEAISNLNHIYGFVSPNIPRSLDVAFKAMERPQGEWYYSCDKGWECNQCHKIVKDMPIDDNKKATYDFCPNCGVKMKGGAEE